MKNSKSTPLTEAEIVDIYFDRLCDRVFVGEPENNYWLVAKALFNKEYRHFVPNDDNREGDGIQLRYQIFSEIEAEFDQSIDFDSVDGPCNLLEMLIALAYRCSDITYGPGSNDENHVKWFWEMFHNLSLDEYPDETYFDLYNMMQVDKILEDLLERRYNHDGHGGLFPLKDPMRDQREVEIWYQMNAYINENINFYDVSV